MIRCCFLFYPPSSCVKCCSLEDLQNPTSANQQTGSCCYEPRLWSKEAKHNCCRETEHTQLRKVQIRTEAPNAELQRWRSDKPGVCPDRSVRTVFLQSLFLDLQIFVTTLKVIRLQPPFRVATVNYIYLLCVFSLDTLPDPTLLAQDRRHGGPLFPGGWDFILQPSVAQPNHLPMSP